MGRSPPPPGSATGKLATQYELNRWDDVYVPNAEVRVTACHPDTSLGVSATCHEANGGPSIVRSQGWYSNSKKDTSVTLSCDFWNNFWFWMICSRQKFLHKTASKKHLAVHTIWRKKSCLEHWKQSMKIPPVCGRCHQRPRGVSLVPKVPKLPSHLPFIPWLSTLVLLALAFTPIGVGPDHVIKGANQRTLAAGNGEIGRSTVPGYFNALRFREEEKLADELVAK